VRRFKVDCPHNEMMIKADAVQRISEEVMEFLGIGRTRVTAVIADHAHRPVSLRFESTGLTVSDRAKGEERLWI